MRHAILMSALIMLTIPTATADEGGNRCEFGTPLLSNNDRILEAPQVATFQIKVGAWLQKPDGSSGRGVEWMILDCSNYRCFASVVSPAGVRECLDMAKEIVDEVGDTPIVDPGQLPKGVRIGTLQYAVPGEIPGEGGLYLDDDYWLSDETLRLLALFAILDAVLTGTPCWSDGNPAFCAG